MLSRRAVLLDDIYVVQNGLIGYWHYKQGVTSTVWSNIAPNTLGTLNGTVTGATLQGTGVFFNGSSNKITISSFPTTSNWTIEFAVTYTNEAQYAGGYPFSHFVSTSKRGDLRFTQDPSFRYITYSGDDGSTIITSPNQTITANVVNFVTAHYNASTQVFSLFINGTKYSVTASNFTVSTIGGRLVLGVRDYNGSYFDYFQGTMHFFRVYNRNLTDGEINQNILLGRDKIGL